jgi:hypothetical protein
MLACVGRLGAAPLLELDHDIRVFTGSRMYAGEDYVGSPTGQWKLVLHEHFDPVQSGVGQVASEHGQAALPGPDLPRGGAAPGGRMYVLGDGFRQSGLVGRGEQVVDRQP